MSDGEVVQATYRPFTKMWMHFGRRLNEMVYKMPSLFPAGKRNRAIMIKQRWAGDGHLALMIDGLVELQSDGGTQIFPLKHFCLREEEEGVADLFASPDADPYVELDAITDEGLKQFVDAYPGEAVTKEDIFHYVYGTLHSQDYRELYADNLARELPRIPLVNTAEAFRAFRDAGKALGDLHLGYEAVEPYPVTLKQGDLRLADIKDREAFFRVERMRFAGAGRKKDRTTVIYNSNITMVGIPLEAYGYVINGKPALEWLMERQVVKTDPASGIVWDCNKYAVETMGDPAYPFDLFRRMITVSLETQKIVASLPPLEVKTPEVFA